jgi:hypothetical protein
MSSKFGEIVKREYGTDNWVLAARRTSSIVRRYGEDVVVLSKKKYARLEQQLEWENAPDHPARELIAKLLRERYPAIGFIRALRAEGFKIERARDDDLTSMVPGTYSHD